MRCHPSLLVLGITCLVLATSTGCRKLRKTAPADEPIGEQVPEGGHAVLPDAARWEESRLPELGLALRLPAAVKVTHAGNGALLGPNFFLTSGAEQDFVMAPKLYVGSDKDPIAAQRGYCTDGAKKGSRFLYEDPTTLIVRLPSRKGPNKTYAEHCEVTACSSTSPRFCVEASEHERDGQCARVAAIVRSLRLLPKGP